ncbi:DnaT-like ssDNA-binding protein [Arsenophonus apicola]|uniref:DnaT-like ssDNA-binding protein n=1 Tax=Arsenophonus apicola TaxID=2879119 RepID=UPI001CDCAAFA|nr:DnaT-like ssDNA-binding protein [Arsenophonus apicola]UBX27916.1 hypothetical protein LDL57_08445 [Arsenophonus apicola]
MPVKEELIYPLMAHILSRCWWSAMDYLTSQPWLGKRTHLTQPLSFPRTGLFYDGVPIENDAIPKQLIMAQCRLAIESENEDLQPTLGAK